MAALRLPVEHGNGSRPARLFPIVLLIALLLRLRGIATMPLRLDEERTLDMARRPLAEILRAGDTAHPPGYPLLVHPLLALGAPQWSARLPALFAGVLGVVVLYAGLRRAASAPLALAAAACLSLSVHAIAYSQDARGYSAMSALVGAGAFACAAFVRSDEPRHLALALVACALAVGFHYMALPSVVALVAFLAIRGLAGRLRRRERRPRVALLAIGSAFAVAVGLGAWILRSRIASLASFEPLEATTRLRVDAWFVANVLARWSGLGSGFGAFALCLVAIGSLDAFQRDRRLAAALILATAAPFAAVAVVPWVHFFESRYLMAAQIPAFALGALGAGRVGEWTARAIGALSHARLDLGRSTGAVLSGVLILAQARPTTLHARAPRKYLPAGETDGFGRRYVVFHSSLEPRMLHGTREWVLEPASLGPVRLILPDWIRTSTIAADGQFRVRLDCPDSSEYLWVGLRPAPARTEFLLPWGATDDGTLAPASRVTIAPVFDPENGRRSAATSLLAEFDRPRLELKLELYSTDLERADRYLERAARSLRSLP